MGVLAWARRSVDNAVQALGGFQITDLLPQRNFPAVTRDLMAQVRLYTDDMGGALATTGSLNAYVVTTGSGVTELRPGIKLLIRADRANTGEATINVDGLGPLPWVDAGGARLAAGQVAAGRFYEIVLDPVARAWRVQAGASTLDEIPGLIGLRTEVAANATDARSAATSTAADRTAAAASASAATTANTNAQSARVGAEAARDQVQGTITDVSRLNLLTGLFTRVGGRLGLGTASPQTDYDVRGRSSVGMVAPQPSDLAGDPVHTVIQDPSSIAAARYVRPNVATMDMRMLGTVGSTSNPPRADITHADTGTAMLTWMLDGSARIGKGIIPKTDFHVLGRAAVSDTPGLLDADIAGGAPLVTLATNGASGAHLRLVKTDVGAADLILQGTAADRSLNRLDVYDRDHDKYPLTVMLNGIPRVGIGGIVPLDTLHTEGTIRISSAAQGGSTQMLYPLAPDGSALGGGRSAELTLRNTLPALNVLALQNMSAAGFSAVVVRDQYGVEHGAFGWGNDGTGGPFGGATFIEGSVYDGTAHTKPPPPVKIVTTGFMKAPDAPGAYGNYERVTVRADGFFSLPNIRFGVPDLNFNQWDSLLGIKVANPLVEVQVNGAICAADTQTPNAGDIRAGYRVNVVSATGLAARLVKSNVGKADLEIRGTAGGMDRRFSIIDPDNGAIEVLSAMLNGSGAVGIKSPAPPPGMVLSVGGAIQIGDCTVGTLPPTAPGGAVVVTNARKSGENAGAGTGVLAVCISTAWQRFPDYGPIVA